MPINRIKLVLEGLEKDHGDVRLEVFVSELERLQTLLNKVDQSQTGGERSTYFAVVGLSHSSPATVEIELRNRTPDIDMRGEVAARLSHLIESVATDKIDEDVDFSLLESMRDLSRPVGTALRSAILTINGSTFDISTSLSASLERHLQTQETCFGTIEGALEKINVHAGANNFTIYPDIGPKSLQCHFPSHLEEKALAAIKHRIAVSGLLHYRQKARFPHKIEVADIQIYGTDLGSFHDLRGVAPDATGELSSEDFIREIRNGWH